MLDLELVHVSMRKKPDQRSIEAAHTSNRQNSRARAEIMAAVSKGCLADQIKSLERNAAGEIGVKLGIMSAAIHLGEYGVITEQQRLAPEIAGDLFEPFISITFISIKREGMGICLSISQSIIEAHGGILVSEPRSEGRRTFRFARPAVSRGKANAAC
ncbi:hypothetical protein [Hyphomicrobium sp. ghe19]|uniref:hypothetical protein n=1 Tax=Hyphomicrobium sp. ghe19 TaxID=2682968 RepID=UPI0030CF014D